MPATAERSLTIWADRVHPRVLSAGEGPPVVFLHGAAGLLWDPFLDAVAQQFTVHAPEFPGTSPGDHTGIESVDDWHDLVVYYGELLDELGLERATLIGHSFGGMLACELAAARPDCVGALVLLAPAGLWRDEDPIPAFLTLAPEDLAAVLYHSPEVAAAYMTPPEDPELAGEAMIAFAWALGCTGKFLWPIPDRGLHKRLHRVSAPTLVVWGAEDQLIVPAYAEEFRSRISGAQVETIADAGHMLQQEQPEATASVVAEFLAG
ncbi:MAG TPA: alpha/beta fold hydrolase [Solirubrobacteraceae bacterium]|jgi:pimeloyl-ACP methyl ester carboxylesterase|nr:alpha/beta fold hydrolase [Solirubrobacteraceae bacterium]